VTIVYEASAEAQAVRLKRSIQRLIWPLIDTIHMAPDGKNTKQVGLGGKRPVALALEVEVFFLTPAAMGHFGIIAELHSAKLNKSGLHSIPSGLKNKKIVTGMLYFPKSLQPMPSNNHLNL
jgi:hypothetical protein